MPLLQLRHRALRVLTAVGCLSTAFHHSTAQAPPAKPSQGDTLTTASGLRYIITHHGAGPQARAGQTVSVHYTGTFRSGKKFDSSRDGAGKPLEFRLGAHKVIAGWDEGIALLHIGDRAIFIVPPQLGYGARGAPPDIPANATLIFDVELMGIRGGGGN